MARNFLALAIGVALGCGGLVLAQHDHEDGEKVRVVTEHDIQEKLDGKERMRR